jgi:hypothetical protein
VLILTSGLLERNTSDSHANDSIQFIREPQIQIKKNVTTDIDINVGYIARGILND